MKTFINRLTTTVVLWSMLPLIAGCASSSSGGEHELQRPQTTDCPVGMMLICEGRGQPTRGGAEKEIPNYDRCNCRIAPN